jgi:hypothetical protein
MFFHTNSTRGVRFPLGVPIDAAHCGCSLRSPRNRQPGVVTVGLPIAWLDRDLIADCFATNDMSKPSTLTSQQVSTGHLEFSST